MTREQERSERQHLAAFSGRQSGRGARDNRTVRPLLVSGYVCSSAAAMPATAAPACCAVVPGSRRPMTRSHSVPRSFSHPACAVLMRRKRGDRQPEISRLPELGTGKAVRGHADDGERPPVDDDRLSAAHPSRRQNVAATADTREPRPARRRDDHRRAAARRPAAGSAPSVAKYDPVTRWPRIRSGSPPLPRLNDVGPNASTLEKIPREPSR